MKTLIIGIDCSFSQTGITFNFVNNLTSEKIRFYRVIYDNEKTKNPKKIRNFETINNIVYRMPSNINVPDLAVDYSNINNMDQARITLQTAMASKLIIKTCIENIEHFKPDCVYLSIENFIGAQNQTGKLQFLSLSGLIMLQGCIRKELLMYSVMNNIKFKLATPTPSELKLYFTNDGNADKMKMLKFFIDTYSGEKLIPKISILDVADLNDVIDSFALMYFGYHNLFENSNTIVYDTENI